MTAPGSSPGTFLVTNDPESVSFFDFGTLGGSRFVRFPISAKERVLASSADTLSGSSDEQSPSNHHDPGRARCRFSWRRVEGAYFHLWRAERLRELKGQILDLLRQLEEAEAAAENGAAFKERFDALPADEQRVSPDLCGSDPFART